LILWDLGGQEGLRTIWEKYYSESNAILFVVDSADPDHLQQASEVFGESLSHLHSQHVYDT